MTQLTIPSDRELERMLEHVKKDVFLGTNAAFMGSLLCSHEFHWDKDGSICPNTACNDGRNIWWHTQDFMRCAQDEKGYTLKHELWHTGRLHFLRQGDRDGKIWNAACDYRINNDMIYNGAKLPNNGYWIFDTSLDYNGIMAEEQIYDLLIQKRLPMPTRPMNDLRPVKDPIQQQNIMANVVRAIQAAQMAGQAGNLPGNIVKTLNTFLSPKIPWRNVLHRWMTDLMDELEYTWKKPNRRFQDIYLPSTEEPDGRLEHLVYFLDTSGSIEEQDHITFNSEVKYVKDTLKPKKLTLVQFDEIIQYERVFTEDEPFENIELHGFGGTSLEPVREWINKNRPTAAIIFSDLCCSPMQPLDYPIPTIWAAIRNQRATVPFGTLIHIKD